MREKEVKLTQDLVLLQRQYNEMCRMKDEWMSSYHEMRKERDRYLKECTRLEEYFSDNNTDRDLIE